MTTPTLSPLRADRITGSRLAAILNLSPYTTRRGVMREMVRQHFEDSDEFIVNPIVRWGIEHEAQALADYAEHECLAPGDVHGGQDFIAHPAYDFLGVTPDGLVGDDGLVEVKCPWLASYTHINDRVDYQEQVQLQLECADRDWAHFAVWRPDRELAISTVFREPNWLNDRLPKLNQFMEEYWEIVADPELAEPYRTPLVNMRTDEAWQIAAFEYLEAAEVLSKAELRASDLRQVLVDMAGTKSAKGAGVTVSRAERRGNVDWKAVQSKYIPDIDVEEYRKASSVVFTVRPWTQEKEQ